MSIVESRWLCYRLKQDIMPLKWRKREESQFSLLSRLLAIASRQEIIYVSVLVAIVWHLKEFSLLLGNYVHWLKVKL